MKNKYLLIGVVVLLSIVLFSFVSAQGGTLNINSLYDASSILTINKTTYQGYNYTASSSLWNAYFLNNSNSAQTIRYEKKRWICFYLR